MASTEKMRLAVPGSREVSALLARPPNARGLLVLGHGAGAGMAHPFLAKLAADLAGVGMATLRYQFPYIEERRRVPDKPELLIATVDAAVRKAIEVAPRLPRSEQGSVGKEGRSRWSQDH